MNSLPRIDRRTALKWMLTATASAAILPRLARAESLVPGTVAAKGYGTDPDLMKTYKPGDVWPLTLSESQRLLAAALCDVIIPADSESPSASSVGVVDFIDEWISAPYPEHFEDRGVVMPGLVWIDAEANKRFSKSFVGLSETQKTAICDEICNVASAQNEFKIPARFFGLYRDLTAGGFYTTPQGRKDIRYVGNMPLASFDGPPIEVLRQAGLA